MDLQPLKLFEGYSDKELRNMAKSMKEVRHNAGTEIMVKGGSGVGFMIILEGNAEVHTPDGRTRELGPFDHFGEMALLDHERRSATVIAKTDLRLAAVPEWSFEDFLKEHPDISIRLLKTLSRRLREAEAT